MAAKLIVQEPERYSLTVVDGTQLTIQVGAPAGPSGPTGSDATVTNASVNAAISTNTSATKIALGIISADITDAVSDSSLPENFEKLIKSNADGQLTLGEVFASEVTVGTGGGNGTIWILGGDNPSGITNANGANGVLCAIPTASGTIAITARPDGALSYDDLVNVPAAVSPAASKLVTNAAARLALSLEAAQGFAVVDADTGKTWMLVEGGTPSVSGDWLQLGDRDITAADIIDPQNIVTNARVVSAIGDDLPIVGHEDAIVHFADQLIALQTAEYPADGKYLVVGGSGDSMGTATGFNPYVTLEMVRRFGQGCVASAFLSGSNNFGTGQSVTTVTLAGSASEANADFTYLPNGDYYVLPTTGTVTETPNSGNITAGFRKIRCWYARKSGGGTLTFTVTQNGVALTAKTADTGSGTAGTIGYVDFDAADGLSLNGKPTLVVSNATATSHYLGCYMYLGSGFIPVALGRGGSSYAQALTSNAANLATFCEAMDVRLIFHAVKEEDTDWSDMQTMMDRWATQHAKCSHIWVGATPSPSGDTTTDPASNAAMKAKASSLDMCFVDGQRLLRNVAWLQTIGTATYGWNESSTGPHLSLPARRFIATFIIEKVLLGLNVAGGRFSPLTLEASRNGMLSDASIPATIWAQTSSTIGSTNFTQSTVPDMGKMTYQYTASPAPVSNSGRAGKFMSVGPWLNTRSIYKYRISDGYLIDGVMAVILVGGASQSEAIGMTNTSYNGFRIIHGVDTISGQPVPFIQFAVKGSGTSETVSPKIYHSTTTAAAPHNGGTWVNSTENVYWVEYIGNGSSTSKRFRAWHQSMSVSGSTTRLYERRLIADWTGTITVGGTSDPSTYFGLVTNSAPSAPGGVRSISLQGFRVDPAPRFTTDYSQGDLNW